MPDLTDAPNRLTCEAKEAIRGYIITLIVLPSAFLTIAAGVGGFFLHDLAFNAGSKEALKPAVDELVRVAARVGNAQHEVDVAVSQSQHSVESLNDAAAAARTISAHASQLLNSRTDTLAKALASTPTFRNSAITVIQPTFSDLQHRVDTLQSRTAIGIGPGATINSNWSGGGANPVDTIAYCPAGQVMTGIFFHLGGTCGGSCDPDGRPISYFRVICGAPAVSN